MQQQAKYGAFLILPLKYDPQTLRADQIEQLGPEQPMTTMDLNENIKTMLSGRGKASVGSCRRVGRQALLGALAGQGRQPAALRVDGEDGVFPFAVGESFLYLFHTQVAFLCLRVDFDHMGAVKGICEPGSAQRVSRFFWQEQAGDWREFSMHAWLTEFCARLGLAQFFEGSSTLLLDAYAYILALVPRRFDTLDEMKRITFNLHQMLPPDSPVQDDSEEDLRYVYAVKHKTLDSYRWGCCVASQTLSYVVADPQLDLEAEMQAQAADGLPVAVLSLYEKYTCLRFTQLIAALDEKKADQLRRLKKLMLEFRAFGTVAPANLSRWHNVKQIFANLQQVNDVNAAVQDITDKLNILAEHQQALEQNRNEAVVNIITLFGLISILESVLSLEQTLAGGDQAVWGLAAATLGALLLVLASVLRLRR